MAVLELAALPLLPSASATCPLLLSHLRTARTIQTINSSFPVSYYIQTDDPTILYIIGAWESPAAHAAGIGSLFHAVLEGKVWEKKDVSIGRWRFEKGKEGEFEKAVSGRGVVGGWRIEKEVGDDGKKVEE